jgi:3,4-dihydroxy 2-butanone 4-phosphate synthase / GTP cyclohydrolase II
MLTTLRRRLRAMLTALRGKPFVERVASAKLPTEDGEFDIHVYESGVDGGTHTALVRGELGAGENVLARVHSACLTGDVFHSARCDCGQQLKVAMGRVAAEGRGVILYLNQEGRGIGLANKIRAYALQDEGYDTVEANERLGFPADQREYTTSVLILRDLGIRSIRLMSNNPRKLAGVIGDGVVLSERIPLEVSPSDSNRRYLRTKKEKLGHQLSEV